MENEIKEYTWAEFQELPEPDVIALVEGFRENQEWPHKYQMAGLLHLSDHIYYLKTTGSPRTKFSPQERSLIWHLLTYGPPDGYTAEIKATKTNNEPPREIAPASAVAPA